jgi:Ni,Fe-hydrogenase I large subunit
MVLSCKVWNQTNYKKIHHVLLFFQDIVLHFPHLLPQEWVLIVCYQLVLTSEQSSFAVLASEASLQTIPQSDFWEKALS